MNSSYVQRPPSNGAPKTETDHREKAQADLFTRAEPLADASVLTGENSEDVITPKTRTRRIAILVTHGIGNTARYKTLSAVGQALIDEHTKLGASPPVVNAQAVRLTNQSDALQLSRMEVHLEGTNNNTGSDVHIYENYWAPLTQGEVSYLQVLWILFSRAWDGIRTVLLADGKTTGQYFDRWVFGDFHLFKIRSLALVYLMLTVPMLALLSPAAVPIDRWILSHSHWTLPYVMGLPLRVKCMAVPVVLLYILDLYYVHQFVIQLVGSIAIYVSGHESSRFNTIREKILDSACKISRQIYSAGIVDDRELPYDSVVIVGHSVGSIISYDLLNATINWDRMEHDSKHSVARRTTRLITFGSQLDVAAFVSRSEVSSKRSFREAIVACDQPLILDYREFRPLTTFKWINIYSKMDMFSQRLQYYDRPEDPSRPDPFRNPVDNRRDSQARIPFLAHVQYWRNRALHEALYESIWAQAAVPRT